MNLVMTGVQVCDVNSGEHTVIGDDEAAERTTTIKLVYSFCVRVRAVTFD